MRHNLEKISHTPAVPVFHHWLFRESKWLALIQRAYIAHSYIQSGESSLQIAITSFSLSVFFFFFFLHSHLQRRGQTKKQSTRTAHNLLFLSRRVKGFEKSKCLGKRIQGPQQCCRFSFHVPTPPQSLPHMHLDPFILKKSRRRTKVNCRSQNVSCKLDSLIVR